MLAARSVCRGTPLLMAVARPCGGQRHWVWVAVSWIPAMSSMACQPNTSHHLTLGHTPQKTHLPTLLGFWPTVQANTSTGMCGENCRLSMA